MPIEAYLDPRSAPREPPPLEAMDRSTRELHQAIDERMRRTGRPYLHPEGETIQLDLLGSPNMVAWQEGKAQLMFEGAACWSSLPQVYGRYGTETTRALIVEVCALEGATGAVLTDCGMQACASLFDVLLEPGSHAILLRQVYNKTRKYVEWLSARIGGLYSIVDDGDYEALEQALRSETALIFAETYTNPLMRAADPRRLGALAVEARKARSRNLRLVVDDTIATPWGLKKPLLEHEGIDFVVSSGTKALGGQDRDLWGYVASRRLDELNELMDLLAMRGGILDWRRAGAILEGLPEARRRFERRCASAAEVAAFLSGHAQVSDVHHPSLAGHADRKVIDSFYALPGSLLSFRIAGASEEETRHFCDVLAMSIVPRYALSFDGLATKLNHHRTVSEYFTPVEELERAGIDRLVRLGIGLEAPRDLIACLNWALWHHLEVRPEAAAAWRRARARDLGIYPEGDAP
jgi:cystathionine beta-lyase/cystathionine gamma-synthase